MEINKLSNDQLEEQIKLFQVRIEEQNNIIHIDILPF
jgi:hypothetical protein